MLDDDGIILEGRPPELKKTPEFSLFRALQHPKLHEQHPGSTAELQSSSERHGVAGIGGKRRQSET